MTEPAAQPPPARPPRRPTPKRGTCGNCGRTDQPLPAFGRCWACYARPRRPPSRPADTPALEQERQHHLAVVYAARRRVQQAITRQHDARRLLRTRVRLAYADGLSYNQLADLTDLPVMSVHALVPPSLSRPPGNPTARADGDKVTEWRGSIRGAVDEMDAANDAAREARTQLRELLVAATDPQDPGRVSVEQIGAALGVSFGAVLRWRGGGHPARQNRTEEPE